MKGYLHEGNGVVAHLVLDGDLVRDVQAGVGMASKGEGVWLAHPPHLAPLHRVAQLLLVDGDGFHLNLQMHETFNRCKDLKSVPVHEMINFNSR